MGQNRERHHETKGWRSLKGDANGGAVQKAVEGEPTSGKTTTMENVAAMLPAMTMREENSIKQKVAEESNSHQSKRRDRKLSGRQNLHRFRQKIKKSDTKHRTGCKTQNQMEPIAKAKRHQTAAEGSEESANGNKRQHILYCNISVKRLISSALTNATSPATMAPAASG